MKTSGQDLLKEIRSIRSLPRQKRRKRRNETDREYIFRTARYRCQYCLLPFPEKDLHAVRKHPKEKLPLLYDGICSCTKCAHKKGSLTHKEFLRALKEKKKETRKEAYENSKELNQVVFEKYQYTCIYCTYEYGYMPKGRWLTKDHKMPISRGGTNELKNLACACLYHNRDKDNRTADEYFKVIDKRKQRRNNHSKTH